MKPQENMSGTGERYHDLEEIVCVEQVLDKINLTTLTDQEEKEFLVLEVDLKEVLVVCAESELVVWFWICSARVGRYRAQVSSQKLSRKA